MFWRRKKEPEAPKPGENRIEALANRVLPTGGVSALESELAKIDPSTLEGAERESWHHLYGIAALRQGNRDLAFERFQEGAQQCPDSGFLLFALGQEYEFRGEADLAFDCFDGALFPKVSGEYALVEARFAYLWNRTDKGWSYLEPLMAAYFDLKILDTNFLYMRGLPFFEETLAYLAAFSQLDGDFGDLNVLTRRAESECRDFDCDYLKARLEGVQSGDFTALKKKLRDSIQAAKSGKTPFPCGYQTMQLNILLAQEANDYYEAFRILDSVALAENDFPWLDDIRLLAKCEQAHKVHNTEQETVFSTRFLTRQPLLFEPDHAVNFNLIDYQENLKDEYRKTRQRNG